MTDEKAAEGPAAPSVDTGLPVVEAAPEDAPTEEATPEEEKRRRRKRALLLLLLGLLAMLVTIAIWYLLFRQPIPVPLPVIPDSNLPAYSTSVYGATGPFGVAVSPDGGRIYVTESEGERIVRIFDGAGAPVGTASPAEETGTEHVPMFLAVDPLTSELYVTDRPTGEIYVYDATGTYQRTLTLAKPIPGWQPIGIAFDAAGLLYVTDRAGPFARVEVFDREAKLVRTFGENEQLNFPSGIAVDSKGRAYVADSNNGRLLVFGTDGSLVAQVGRGAGTGNLGLPRGVAVDNQDRVFVGDSTAQGVFVYRTPADNNRRLDYIGFFGSQGTADGEFNFPNGVGVDTRGRVYVADTVNNRVQVWSY